MRQRVGIARALAVDPAVLLMDEPFSALDAQTRTLMMEELLGIWERTRKSIAYVTHNIQEAVFMADRSSCCRAGPGG
jgi:NitT/TauT family transport system ATP-binding protein